MSAVGSPDGSWAVVLGVSAGTGAAIARAVAEDPGLHVFGAHGGGHPDLADALRSDIGRSGQHFEPFVGVSGGMTQSLLDLVLVEGAP